jgi:hypothetical protein
MEEPASGLKGRLEAQAEGWNGVSSAPYPTLTGPASDDFFAETAIPVGKEERFLRRQPPWSACWSTIHLNVIRCAQMVKPSFKPRLPATGIPRRVLRCVLRFEGRL